MTPTGPIEPWIPGPRTTLATTRIFTLESQQWTCPTEPDRSGNFAVINSPDWVNVLAITPDENMVLVEQFRFGVAGLSLEIPGGIVDPGEEPATTAVRELAEETGYVGDPPIPLGAISGNAAILNNRVHTYLVRNARLDRPQNLDENEQIRVVLAPLSDAPRLLRSGTIHHSIVVAAFALYNAWTREQE
ncbi:MAG: NUDIX hydrolase [Phycisphaeraceae bacterium]|nr:NUDIX hydrolase [Phycisphaeraceae bacterium]MCW5763603.1 NUDIX hydrolase [Phycisphaeraceae bacterium]